MAHLFELAHKQLYLSFVRLRTSVSPNSDTSAILVVDSAQLQAVVRCQYLSFVLAGYSVYNIQHRQSQQLTHPGVLTMLGSVQCWRCSGLTWCLAWTGAAQKASNL